MTHPVSFAEQLGTQIQVGDNKIRGESKHKQCRIELLFIWKKIVLTILLTANNKRIIKEQSSSNNHGMLRSFPSNIKIHKVNYTCTSRIVVIYEGMLLE